MRIGENYGEKREEEKQKEHMERNLVVIRKFTGFVSQYKISLAISTHTIKYKVHCN